MMITLLSDNRRLLRSPGITTALGGVRAFLPLGVAPLLRAAAAVLRAAGVSTAAGEAAALRRLALLLFAGVVVVTILLSATNSSGVIPAEFIWVSCCSVSASSLSISEYPCCLSASACVLIFESNFKRFSASVTTFLPYASFRRLNDFRPNIRQKRHAGASKPHTGTPWLCMHGMQKGCASQPLILCRQPLAYE